MLTHRTRDFTIAHFQIQLNKEHKRTQLEPSNSYTFHNEAEPHSGRRRCDAPICSLAKFSSVPMFGENSPQNFDAAGSIRNSTPIHPPTVCRNNRLSFPQSPNLNKAF